MKSFRFIVLSLGSLIYLFFVIRAEETIKKKYTDIQQCLGGSQVFRTESMKQASIRVWPLNDPEFRTCHIRNICLVNGSLTYFQRYPENRVPKEYLPSGFEGNIAHLSYLRGFTMPIKTSIGEIPSDYSFHDRKYMFLDANSWSFNYGHYLNDNVIPTFIVSKLFNFPIEEAQQVFETSCRLFSNLEPAFSDRIVTYNRSMGTYRDACLERLNHMWVYFYNYPPIYADAYKTKNICFHNLYLGAGSTFGLKSIDLSRGYFFREFRDYVLKRIPRKQPEQENLVLVGLRTVGSAGGAIIADLCHRVKRSMEDVSEIYRDKFKVECFIPSNLQLDDEIAQVQRAKVLISVHGTITYMSLFSRDGTQQISLASPKELKENQMLLYATHFNTMYLTWDKMDQLTGVLEHALTLSESYHNP